MENNEQEIYVTNDCKVTVCFQKNSHPELVEPIKNILLQTKIGAKNNLHIRQSED